MTKFGTSEACF